MYLIDVNDVVTIPFANEDWIIEDDIILKPHKYFKKLFFREQKAGLADELADAVGGGFKKNIGLFIPRYGNISNRWVFDMIGTRFVMLLQDFNNQTILVGSVISPMRMEKAMGNTGQKVSDENGWSVNIIAESNRPCYLYSGIILNSSNIDVNIFTAYWGWKSTPFSTSTIENFNFQAGGIYDIGSDIIADYTLAPANSFLCLKYPKTEALKLNWYNYVFNYGTIPDQVFEDTYITDEFYYVFTRVPPALQKDNKKITFT